MDLNLQEGENHKTTIVFMSCVLCACERENKKISFLYYKIV